VQHINAIKQSISDLSKVIQFVKVFECSRRSICFACLAVGVYSH